MGSELRFRGVEVPSHITSIWSAQALSEAPDAIVGIHADNIAAGADVITANNYAVTVPLLKRAGLEDRVAELTGLAVDLAQRARDAADRPVRIAGSLPPLGTSYRSELVGADDEILAQYRQIAAVLAPRVDVLLCETLSSAREARAAALAASETDREVWLSWTLQGDRKDRLPSGETVSEAIEAVADLRIDAFLINCCGANFATSALRILAGLTDCPIGAYANSADVIPAAPDAAVRDPEAAERQPLDEAGYAAAVERWLDLGARIVGGCCSTRPSHIARLRHLLDARA